MIQILKVILAIFLLSSSVKPPKATIKFVGWEMLNICAALDLIDDSDFKIENYVLKYIVDDVDLKILRDRYSQRNELPPIRDAELFGYMSPAAVKAARLLSQSHIRYLEEASELYPENQFFPRAIKDTKVAYEAWDKLDNVNISHLGLFARRKNLLEVKKIIGNENFIHGIMPPPIPLWIQKEIRP